MPSTVIYTVNVEFGDCDPAGIVWFPNFFRWLDAASRHFFMTCGVPRWETLRDSTGIIGTPLVNTQTRFVKSATYGDVLAIHVGVREWRNKSFVQTYEVRRGEDLILASEEVRIFAAQREDGAGIQAMPIPPDIRALCER